MPSEPDGSTTRVVPLSASGNEDAEFSMVCIMVRTIKSPLRNSERKGKFRMMYEVAVLFHKYIVYRDRMCVGNDSYLGE